MAENTNAAEVKSTETESKELTEAQLAEMFKALPAEFQTTIKTLNDEIEEHNKAIDAIKRSEAKDPKLIKAEIFEQNPSNNKKIARIYEEYLKLIEAAEKLKDQAYGIIDTDGLMPKDLDEAEIEKLKTEATASTKNLRDKANTLEMFESMMPTLKGKLTVHLNEIKTRRGAAKTGGAGTSGQTGTKRLRFKKLLVNGLDQETINGKTVTVWQEVNGEPKYTFTFLSQFLKKKSAVINWTAKDLTDAYLQGVDEDNLPDEHKFTMVHTYKDEQGNEHSVNYEVTAIR